MAEKTIGEAINEVTEADVAGEETAEETTETAEGTAEETGEAEAEEEAAEGAESEAEEEDAGEGEGEEEEAEEEEDEESTPFEDLTPEQLRAIKDSPELTAVYKGLMKRWTKKTQLASEALRLTEAYRRDPVGVLTAIASAQGYEVTKPGAHSAADEKAPKSDPLSVAEKKLEGLFGEKLGPQVRGVLDEWFDARVGGHVTPLKDTLGRVVNQGEAARMMSEEQAFKVRHSKSLTPELEAEVVKLGNSGLIVPGPDMTPSTYLDTLLEIVRARAARKEAAAAKSSASKKLAQRISKNASDREPSGVSAKAGVKKVSKIPEARSISEAIDFAAKELDEESA